MWFLLEFSVLCSTQIEPPHPTRTCCCDFEESTRIGSTHLTTCCCDLEISSLCVEDWTLSPLTLWPSYSSVHPRTRPLSTWCIGPNFTSIEFFHLLRSNRPVLREDCFPTSHTRIHKLRVSPPRRSHANGKSQWLCKENQIQLYQYNDYAHRLIWTLTPAHFAIQRLREERRHVHAVRELMDLIL